MFNLAFAAAGNQAKHVVRRRTLPPFDLEKFLRERKPALWSQTLNAVDLATLPT
jgi:hypothetical protein